MSLSMTILPSRLYRGQVVLSEVVVEGYAF